MFDYLVTAFWYIAGTIVFCAIIIGLAKLVDHVLNDLTDRDPW